MRKTSRCCWHRAACPEPYNTFVQPCTQNTRPPLPAGLRMTKAHVTHPELKATFSLDILGVKKNPNGAMYSSLGVITKGEWVGFELRGRSLPQERVSLCRDMLDGLDQRRITPWGAQGTWAGSGCTMWEDAACSCMPPGQAGRLSGASGLLVGSRPCAVLLLVGVAEHSASTMMGWQRLRADASTAVPQPMQTGCS